jgi:glycosyltransferase involved in cell wall biosynthesis
MACARLVAKLITTAKRLFGVKGDLAPRAARYCLPFMSRLPGHYDLAIGFLKPHEMLLHKVSAVRKAAWIHTDYTKVETGVDTAFELECWAKFDKIVAVSDGVASTFIQVFPTLIEKVITIENVLSASMVRTEARAFDATVEMPRSPGVARLCSVGRFTYQKGFDLAVEACGLLRASGRQVRWYLIGYGADEPVLRKKIQQLGLEDYFVILGKRVNPYPYMAECDIYVQPSRYEGKSVCVREAQMLGKTVLIADFPTAAAQLEDGADGLITSGSTQGIAAGIARLMDDPVLSTRLARCAQSRNYDNLSEAAKVVALCHCNSHARA